MISRFIMKMIIAAVLALIAVTGFGVFYLVQNPPAHRRGQRSLIPAPTSSADQAAIDVFKYIYSRSHSYEYAGVILKWPGEQYIASWPETDVEGLASRIDEDADHYPGAIIVADYHTHPCVDGAYTYAFSPMDLSSMRAGKIPGYLADFCTGNIHYWALGDKLDAPIFGVRVPLASGKIIGRIVVDGAVLE